MIRYRFSIIFEYSGSISKQLILIRLLTEIHAYSICIVCDLLNRHLTLSLVSKKTCEEHFINLFLFYFLELHCPPPSVDTDLLKKCTRNRKRSLGRTFGSSRQKTSPWQISISSLHTKRKTSSSGLSETVRETTL